MKRKSLFLRLLVIIMAVTAGVTLVSCGNDDSGENSEENQFFIIGTVRGFLWDFGWEFHVSTSGDTVDTGSTIICPLTEMEIIDFRKDLTAYYYTLTKTEHATAINNLCLEYGKSRITPCYDGTWMTLTSYPEWSYFNGKIIDSHSESIVKNPKKLTYSVNTDNNSITFLDEDGKEWKVLYLNLSTTMKTLELRDAEGQLCYHNWDPTEPLDNSRFTKK